uniref:protein CEBPZOS-like n=1 Tax=Doryrhamphus excisus TaxID=161450 RepID=UPI0025AE0A36|nr:protein CEBPZOS-like [Doryrhamphus excisus]
MSPKPLAPLAKKLMKVVIVVELLGIFGAYKLFDMMNSSQDLRSRMSRRFPAILEVYYKSNELAGVHGIRERDQLDWMATRD